jgi:hypothetical protein
MPPYRIHRSALRQHEKDAEEAGRGAVIPTPPPLSLTTPV